MKPYFHSFICLLLLTISTGLTADEMDKKNSIESRYVYTLGYRAGQSLKAQNIHRLDSVRFSKGVSDIMQGKQPDVRQDGSSADAKLDVHDSYLMGYQIGQSLMSQGIRDLDVDSLVEGINDSLQGSKPRLDEIEMVDALTSFKAYQKALRKNDPKANMADARAYLAANRKREAIVETASGLQYEVIRPAQGMLAMPHNKVRVHYHGTFADGEVFDSSVSRGKPAEFRLNEVVPGLAEALAQMHVGEKWRIYVPPALGYGTRGVSGSIGPNELLIFEIELLEILD